MASRTLWESSPFIQPRIRPGAYHVGGFWTCISMIESNVPLSTARVYIASLMILMIYMLPVLDIQRQYVVARLSLEIFQGILDFVVIQQRHHRSIFV